MVTHRSVIAHSLITPISSVGFGMSSAALTFSWSGCTPCAVSLSPKNTISCTSNWHLLLPSIYLCTLALLVFLHYRAPDNYLIHINLDIFQSFCSMPHCPVKYIGDSPRLFQKVVLGNSICQTVYWRCSMWCCFHSALIPRNLVKCRTLVVQGLFLQHAQLVHALRHSLAQFYMWMVF